LVTYYSKSALRMMPSLEWFHFVILFKTDLGIVYYLPTVLIKMVDFDHCFVIISYQTKPEKISFSLGSTQRLWLVLIAKLFQVQLWVFELWVYFQVVSFLKLLFCNLSIQSSFNPIAELHHLQLSFAAPILALFLFQYI
jgi:hypothetical protein